MKTEYRLAEALKNMMSEVPLDSISVTSLTRRCHVNRQTFYYHFHDIYDLLTLVFLDEKVPHVEEAKNIEEGSNAVLLAPEKLPEGISTENESSGSILGSSSGLSTKRICFCSVLR